jgi:hypothetical protein
VERQHRRGIFSFSGENRSGSRTGQHPGRFDLLLACTLIMATVVVLINRLVWRRLYRLASTRFKLES